MDKKTFFMLFLLSFMFINISGCGNTPKENPQLAEYESKLKTYYDDIITTSESLNSINPEDANSKETYLNYIDSIKASVSGIDALEDPEGYEEVGTNAYAALTQINNTSTLLHQIYLDNEYDWDKDNEAYNSYIECMKSLNSIGKILMTKNQ